jgi:uridine kinase
MRYIVAVAAPIGAGKTSLVKAIANKLKDATTIHYDSYEKASEEPVQHLMQWIKNGANFDHFTVPNLATDLRKLKRGESVIDPLTTMEIPSHKYIIFEMPLGKEHKDTAEYIDLLIWIEIPLDIALARKVREFTGIFLAKHKQEMLRDSILWLDKYLENYLGIVRDVLQIQKKRVSVKADVVIDGQSDFETMVQLATREILNRIP